MSLSVNPKSLTQDFVTSENAGEILIYNLNTHECFCLNSTAARVWNLSNGNRSSGEIAELLSREVKSHVSEEMVLLALATLKNNKLINENWKSSIPFSSLMRRSLIKKIGLASIIALPVITRLIVPTPAMAASTCPATGPGAIGTTCTCPNGGATFCSSPTCANGCSCTNLGADDSAGAGLRSGTCDE